MSDQDDRAKQAAAEAAAELVEAGMTIGLGTGSTVAFFLPALARRRLAVRCVATSPATEAAGRRLGLDVVAFEGISRLDLAIDGADQVDPAGELIKGGGAAHTREKVVAAAADRFVVIVHPDKLVSALTPPVPVELLAFGLDATLAALPDVRRRAGSGPSPDGGVIADHWGPVGDATALAARLDAVPGVVAHGLFPARMVGEVLVGRDDGSVERRSPRPV